MQETTTLAITWFIWDFDQAVTYEHTFPRQGNNTIYNQKPSYELDQQTLLKNIRNVDWFRDFCKRTAAKGVVHTIATGHNDWHHIHHYLFNIFGHQADNIFKFIHCGSKSKVTAIRETAEKLGFVKGSPNYPHVTLLDDQPKNAEEARKAGFNAIIVDPSNNYIKEVEVLIATQLEGTISNTEYHTPIMMFGNASQNSLMRKSMDELNPIATTFEFDYKPTSP